MEEIEEMENYEAGEEACMADGDSTSVLFLFSVCKG